MTKKRLLIFLVFLVTNVFAQKNHFMAIQSENKQPFHAKANGNILNSTPAGHLIIPKLVDSTYMITIGFTTTTVAEEQFSIAITKDVGFILKIGKDKRLVLSNSQTAQLITPIRQQQYFVSEDSATTTGTTSASKKTDQSFSKLMAQVVNDSAVMENMYVADEPKTELAKIETPAKPAITNDSVDGQQKKKNEITKIETPSKPVVTVDSSAITQRKKKSEDTTLHRKIAVSKTPEKKEKLIQQQTQPVVTKLSEKKNGSTVELVYEDVTKNGKKDTINITIPFDSIVNKSAVVNTNKKETIIPETKPGVKSDTAKFMAAKSIPVIKDSSKIASSEKSLTKAQTKNVKKDSSVVDTTKSKLYRPLVTNVNCKNTATDYDVDKLRVKIMAIDDEDDKISTAKKVFKAKCFSTNQIKALSEVFSNDAGKYKLFDAAYAYVYDLNNFTSLQSLLKDDYYISRFKAMIK